MKVEVDQITMINNNMDHMFQYLQVKSWFGLSLKKVKVVFVAIGDIQVFFGGFVAAPA